MTPIPPHFVVRAVACPECGAPGGHPCVGTRAIDQSHHAARILAASGAEVAPPPRRPYDRTLEEQQAVPAGHEDGDPRAGETSAVTFTDAQRAGGLAALEVARALLAEHRATTVAGRDQRET